MSFPDCRAHLVRLTADGGLKAPMACTYPLERALDAAEPSPPAPRHSGTTPRALQHPGLRGYLTAMMSVGRMSGSSASKSEAT